MPVQCVPVPGHRHLYIPSVIPVIPNSIPFVAKREVKIMQHGGQIWASVSENAVAFSS